MVDLDKLDDDKNRDSDKKSGSTDSGGNSSNSGGGSGGSAVSDDTFSIDKDDMSEPLDSPPDISERWADEHGQVNYDAGSSGNLQQYMKKQKNETQELHDNMKEMLPQHFGNIDEFSIYFHAFFINFGVNRAGIMDILQGRFGKSEAEAVKLTDKICKSAGEDEMINHLLREFSKAGVE